MGIPFLASMLINSKKTVSKKIDGLVTRFNVFQGKHYILWALAIGGIVTMNAMLWSILVDDWFFPLFSEDTLINLLPFVVIEELAKVLGICFLISTRKNVSGLSVILIPAVFQIGELAAELINGFGFWGIAYPFHIISGIIYLRFLRLSKKMLFVAFSVNLLLHWAWNIQATMVKYYSDQMVMLSMFAWVVLAVYAFKTLVNKTGEFSKGERGKGTRIAHPKVY